MPKLRNQLPSYPLHKSSNQPVVTLNGRDVYLGRYNSSESQERFERVEARLSGRSHVSHSGASKGKGGGALWLLSDRISPRPHK